jgi:hypothetical protein
MHGQLVMADVIMLNTSKGFALYTVDRSVGGVSTKIGHDGICYAHPAFTLGCDDWMSHTPSGKTSDSSINLGCASWSSLIILRTWAVEMPRSREVECLRSESANLTQRITRQSSFRPRCSTEYAVRLYRHGIITLQYWNTGDNRFP